ncbi:MAG: ribonuclease D [Acidobacteriota bacterium]
MRVDSAATLSDACRRWRRCGVLAVDTEFVRERTFFPRLGLIQIADNTRIYLVDPIALDDLEPLGQILASPEIVKVFHSCGEDLEVLYHRFGELPRPLFDTQVAATVLGIGYSVGYGKLVEALFGLSLEKGQTRTDWLRRPLTPAQEGYAAQDVEHLIPAYRRLAADLESQNRTAWAREETERLFDTGRFLPTPEQIYRRFRRAHTMSRRELAALQRLCVWREREARRRDLPRNFVLPEAALPRLAKARPRNRQQLAAIRDLRPKDRERHGGRLLALLREVAALEPEDLPPKLRPPLNLTPYKKEIDHLRQQVGRRADELGIAPEVLATKKLVQQLVRRVVNRQNPALPELLRGWRREVIGDALLQQIRLALPDVTS